MVSGPDILSCVFCFVWVEGLGWDGMRWCLWGWCVEFDVDCFYDYYLCIICLRCLLCFIRFWNVGMVLIVGVGFMLPVVAAWWQLYSLQLN